MPKLLSLTLCCAVLCCAVLCCAVLCCAELQCAPKLCCAVLCCAMLLCAPKLCYAVLCCAVLCCAALRCAVLCCAALRYFVLQYFVAWQWYHVLQALCKCLGEDLTSAQVHKHEHKWQHMSQFFTQTAMHLKSLFSVSKCNALKVSELQKPQALSQKRRSELAPQSTCLL